jgi:uncharacterized cupin superfamily protein
MGRPRAIVNEAAIAWSESSSGDTFRFRRKALGAASGARMLGASLYEVAPGASAWPFHYHSANEEAIFILEGAGTLRLGDGEHLVQKGDYIALPTGPEHAHRLLNTSDKPLVYLCLSTMVEPEVSFYPDSGKFGVMVGSPPGGEKSRRTFEGSFRANAKVPYFDGEPDA